MSLDKHLCFAVIVAVVISISSSNASQGNKFAGNLVPDTSSKPNAPQPSNDATTDSAGQLSPVVNSSQAEANVDDIVHIVSSVNADHDGSSVNTPDAQDATITQSAKKKQARKSSPPPVGVAESVGFVPTPEKEEQNEEEEVVVDKENRVVNFIPSLPARFEIDFSLESCDHYHLLSAVLSSLVAC